MLCADVDGSQDGHYALRTQMRYPVFILVTLVLTGWLLAGCERHSGEQQAIQEILNGAEVSSSGVLEPRAEEVLRSIANRLRTDEPDAPLQVMGLLHQLRDGQHGALILVEAMKSRQHEMRRNAVTVLGMLKADWSVPLLRRATDDSSAAVRRGALYALCKIDPDGSRFLFLLGLKDGAWEVRAEAAAALAALGDPSTLKYLTRQLDEKDEFALYQIVGAIYLIAGEEDTAHFQAMLSRPETAVHAGVAIIVLAKNGALGEPERLRDLLIESKGEWRLFGVEPYVKLDPVGALELAGKSAISNPPLSSALRAAVQNSAL